MVFWDRFVKRVYLCLGEQEADGLNRAARLFSLAHANGLLIPQELESGTLVLLVSCCPSWMALRTEVDMEFAVRGLNTNSNVLNLRTLFRQMASFRDNDLVAFHYLGDSQQQAQSEEILWREYGPRV